MHKAPIINPRGRFGRCKRKICSGHFRDDVSLTSAVAPCKFVARIERKSGISPLSLVFSFSFSSSCILLPCLRSQQPTLSRASRARPGHQIPMALVLFTAPGKVFIPWQLLQASGKFMGHILFPCLLRLMKRNKVHRKWTGSLVWNGKNPTAD